MDRRLLFPALAMTAVAQTTSPANVAAEKALRARAEEFYKLELGKQFRQAEALVAEDSKDYFYNSGKPNFQDVKVGAIDFSDDPAKAVVHIVVKVELLAPGVGAQVFEAPGTSTWKLENGQWYWYFIQSNSMMTPFGKMNFDSSAGKGGVPPIPGKIPSPSDLQSLVSIDRQAVALNAANPDQTVTISNGLPGGVTISLDGKVSGVAADVAGGELKTGEKTSVKFHRVGNAKSSGTVIIRVLPLGLEFPVQVRVE